MYDMSKLKKRYFELKLPNDNRVLHVEPPRIKVLKKLIRLSNVNEENMTEDDLDNLIEATSLAFSKNKENHYIKPNYIEDSFSVFEIQDLYERYMRWIDSINNQKN